MAPVGAVYAPSSADTVLRQGEIVSGLVQARLAIESVGSEDEPVVDFVLHPFAVVMSQDCDLDWDFRARQEGSSIAKQMPGILFCEAIEAEVLRGSGVNSAVWSRIKINKDERYQFLQAVAPEEDALRQGLPELALDFKRYFTVPTDEAYRRLSIDARRRCRLQSPYLEHLATRFFYYQYRVALPFEHFSE